MKIIVTGACGHIGSKLIRTLPRKIPNCKIVMIDNLMTQRYCSLFNLPSKGNYEFIEGDITKINLEKILNHCSHVIHLAAITDAASSFGKEKEVYKNNYEGTKRLSILCKKKKIKFLLISSTSVYGTQKNLISEDCSDNDLKPQSPYAYCKLKEEKLIQHQIQNGLKASIFRFGTIFGVSPGIRFHTAVNKFCWQAAHGEAVTVWKTAYYQKRPYLALEDAIRAIIYFIKSDKTKGEIYNVLTCNKSVFEIIKFIKKYQKKAKIKFVSNRIMNQLSYEVSNHKIEKTGFKFSGNMKQEIKKTLNSINIGI